MKLIACSVLLLVLLGESYCNTTTTVNQTSTSWGYDYSRTDTSEYEVKHDRTGYHFEPTYNNPSTSLKKHYNSSSVYGHFTSPGINTSVSQSNVNTDFTTNSTVLHNVPLDIDAGASVPNGIAIKPNVTSNAPLSPSQGTVFGDKNGSPNVPVNKLATYAVPYGYRAQNGLMYYPQAPTYGQTYGSVDGLMYGILNGQMNVRPPGPLYGTTYGQPIGPMNGNAPYGYGSQNGQMYGPQNGQMYVPQDSQIFGPQNGQTYGPQSGQSYEPQNGQMYVPGNGQAYGYPTGSLHGSYRNY